MLQGSAYLQSPHKHLSLLHSSKGRGRYGCRARPERLQDPSIDYGRQGPFQTLSYDFDYGDFGDPNLTDNLFNDGAVSRPLFDNLPRRIVNNLDTDYKLVTVVEPIAPDKPGSGDANAQFGLPAYPDRRAVLLISGFQARDECYTDFAKHMASWGYVVLQPNLNDFFTDLRVTDRQLILDLPRLIATLRRKQGLAAVNWSSGMAVVGHSRGGKLAALLHGYSQRDVDANFLARPELGQLTDAELNTIRAMGIKTAFLLDPVNNKWADTLLGFGKAADNFFGFNKDNPSAIALWKALRLDLQQPLTAGIIGAGLGFCIPCYGDPLRPKGNTHKELKNESDDPNSWNMCFPRAAHLDFCQDVWFFWLRKGWGCPKIRHGHGYWVTIINCAIKKLILTECRLPMLTQKVIDLAKPCMLAWLEKNFNPASDDHWYPDWWHRNNARGLVDDC